METPEHTPQELAEAQAAKDAALMESLQARRKDVAANIAAERPHYMNRAERRAQVKYYAAVLAAGNKQEPYVDGTIVPRSQRRRRKGSRYAH